MNSFDYIKNILNSFVEKFPSSKYRYEFDNCSNLHIIEVSPNSLYLEKDFAEFEGNFLINFYKNFDDEGICFITPDDIIHINNPELIVKGDYYIDDNEIDGIQENNLFKINSNYNFALAA
jgi:hypothetical protein